MLIVVQQLKEILSIMGTVNELTSIHALSMHETVTTTFEAETLLKSIIKSSAVLHTTASYFKAKVFALWSLPPHYTGEDQKLTVFFRRTSLQLAQHLQIIHSIKEPIRYNEALGELHG